MKLTINGSEFGMIWGTRAFLLAGKKLSKSIAEIMLGIDDEEILTTLSYCAIQNWYENQDESNVLPFSLTQFSNWLDEQDQKIGNDMVESYLSSTYKGKKMQDRYDSLNEILSENEKKKSIQ